MHGYVFRDLDLDLNRKPALDIDIEQDFFGSDLDLDHLPCFGFATDHDL